MVSLVFKRRRVWFRIHSQVRSVGGADAELTARPRRRDRTVVEVGGLARTDQAGYGEEFATLARLPEEQPAGPVNR